VDWTSVDHVDTVREGVRIGTKDLIRNVIDDVRVQAYQRTDFPTGHGVAAEAERFFTKRVMAYGGYSRVDKDNIVLTGDRYGRGQTCLRRRLSHLPARTHVGGLLHARVRHDFAIAKQPSGSTSCSATTC